MARLARKCVLVLVTVSFLVMVTGLMLQLHLMSCEHPHKHDSDNCSICQQFAALGKFSCRPQLTLDNAHLFEFDIELCPEILYVSSQSKPFDARPPPLVQ